MTFAACESCGGEGHIELPGVGTPGPLACPGCAALLTIISVEPWADWIEAQVAAHERRHRVGQLGSRRQSRRHREADIDRDGLEAELAACLLLCPGSRRQWARRHGTGPDRGADLLAAWTGLDRDIEVKQTRYRDGRRGYLLIRPPRWTPGPMKADYLDDCLYVLMHGANRLYTLVGWTDRPRLLTCGRINPISVFYGRRECWGMHWKQLLKPAALFDRACSHQTECR